MWQPRFGEHTIAADDDHDRHFDKLHDHPGQHGLVEQVCDWPHSSFQRWVRAGVSPPGWGGGAVAALSAEMERLTGER